VTFKAVLERKRRIANAAFIWLCMRVPMATTGNETVSDNASIYFESMLTLNPFWHQMSPHNTRIRGAFVVLGIVCGRFL
jgi:hypothetical protein